MMADIVIIGGGPAGLTAAIYAARSGLDAVVLERMFAGGQAAITPVIENYPGAPGVTGADLAQSMADQAEKAGARILYEDVTGLELGDGIRVRLGEKALSARAVVLCTGAKPKPLGAEGEARLTGSGVSYCATCDGALYRGKEVAVIGGGNTALTDAIYLSALASRVHIIHRRSEYRGDRALAERLRVPPNVVEHLDRVVGQFVGGERLEALNLTSADGTRAEKLLVSGAFVAVGIEPQNALVRDCLALDDAGFVIAGEDCRTAVRGLYVAGDLRAKSIRQVVTAVADGANAAESARADLS